MKKYTPIIISLFTSLSAILFPVVASAQCSLGNAARYFSVGKYQATIKSVSSCSANNSSARFYRGASFEKLGNLESAIKELNSAVELDPRKEEAWYYLGRAYNSLGQKTRDIRHFRSGIKASERAIELNPRDGRYWNNVGALLGQLDYIERGIEYFDKALSLNPPPDVEAIIKGNIEESYRQLNSNRGCPLGYVRKEAICKLLQ
jgi:tetratricopeptide (TPR) repeat protein